MPDRRRISKLLSLILRHRPDEFGLNMDEYGTIPLDEVVEAVQQRYSAVEEEDIRDMVETSRQRRFEIVDDRIRALYGHSFFVEMDGDPMDPPEHLYLCVPSGQARRMKDEGIRSEDRFYLHLSPTREVAESRAGAVVAPCIVAVRAADAAQEADVEFWSRGEVVLTRQAIDPEFVGDIVEIEAPPSTSSDDEEEGRGRGPRGRRGREPRGRGGDSSPSRPQREPSRRERAPRAAAPPASPPPTASGNNGSGHAPDEGEKKVSYGRRPKFGQSSRRR